MEIFVLLLLPTSLLIIHRFSSLIIRRTSAVFTRKLSEKPSLGPLITVCAVGSVTPRLSQYLLPMMNPLEKPSIKRITSPDNSEVNN